MIVPIGEPNFIASPNAQRVKELLYDGKSVPQIASIMHQGYDVIKDWIYEVRKEQMIMANKLTNEQRAEIYRLWKEEGKSQTDIARNFNVSTATVSLIIKKMNGVQDMLNTLSAADAEDKPEPIGQVDEPITMTEEHTAEIPEAVIRAVEDKITDLNTMISDNKERIASLAHQNEKFAERINVLQAWLEGVQK